MQHICTYQSPIGEILLVADDEYLTGLWFVGSKGCPQNLKISTEQILPVITQTIQWLDEYFQGKIPYFPPQLKMRGTKFQMDVWAILLEIPYGQTVTYGSIAQQLATKYGKAKMSAQAVGQAVGRNPISLIVPCHRVVGANTNLVGYGAGVDKKIYLLNLENIKIN